jgi:polysaccharide biosynthesis protein PelC
MVVLSTRPELAAALARPRMFAWQCLVLLPLLALASGCTTVSVQPAPALAANASWALLPIMNFTETPQSGLRAEALLESLLRSGGVTNLKRYPANLNTESLFEPLERKAIEQSLAWARNENFRYAMTGSVEEWRYKVGVDGEPAVGITLQLIDLPSGAVIWTASGSKTGWSREGLSAIAQKLLVELTAPLGTTQRSLLRFW